MLIDLLVLWWLGRSLKGLRRAALQLTWMLGLVLIALAEFKVGAGLARKVTFGSVNGYVVGLRVAGIVTLLQAYFVSSLVWLPRLFDGLEGLVGESLVAVRQLRARKSGFLTVISFLAFLGVGLGAFALCMTISVMGGFGNDLKRKILGNNAHVLIDMERGAFADWHPLLGAVRAMPDVAGAAPLVQGEVMVTSQTNLSGVILRGVDPTGANSVLNLRRDLIRGRVEYLTNPEKLLRLDARDRAPIAGRGEPDPNERINRLPNTGMPVFTTVPGGSAAGGAGADPLPGIIVGRELATNLHLSVGDEVRVVSPFGSVGPMGPVPRTRLFRVAGVFFSGMYEYDTKYAYVTIPVAQRFFNYHEDEITSIEVRLRDIDRSEVVMSAIQELVHNRPLRVRDWRELNQNLFRALKLEKLLIFLLLTVAIIVASFSIVATLLLLVTEKGREIAVLKAMGASDGFITRVFLCVGMMIGVVGALLGVSGAYVTCVAMQRVGIPLDPEVYYIERLPVTISAGDYGLVFLTAVAICLAAATIPAYLAGRLRPVDGLRFG